LCWRILVRCSGCGSTILGRTCGGRSAGAEHADQLTNADVLTLALDDLIQHAVLLSRDFDIDFVGLQIDQRFASSDCVADLLQPLADGRFDD